MIRQFFIRFWAVVRKEVVELLRQNRLILTLVIGPFLILSLFGLGFRNESPTRDIILLDPFNTGLRDEVEAFIPNLGDAVNLVATTTDAVQAEELLKNQTVDLVIIPPQDALGSIRNSEHAEITILHSEIDPFEQATVNVLGRLAADRINQEILTRAADQSKNEAAEANDSVDTTRDHTSAMRAALESGDEERAQTELLALQQETDQLALAAGAMAVYASLQETAGLDSLNETGTNPLLGSTTSLQEQVSGFVINGDDDYTDELTSLDQIDADLADVEVALEEFAAIDSTVLISPFKANVLQLSEVPISDIDFFVPAALALLIQHIAVSFAALSIIRERRLGTLDLLRIAPSSALELLVGKTIGYLVVIIFIAAILTALITLLMGVPMAGSWLIYAGILLAITFLSLGMGFVISTISQTETQAVQLAMLLLLASVFFSGLFLAIERIWLPVRTVSWLLPATYGTALLQDVMLRGQEPNALVFGGLLGLGVLFFLLSWRALSRYLRQE